MIGDSHHINRRVTQSGFRAFDYAKASGRRLTTYAVINLDDTAEQGAVSSFNKIRHKFRDWMTYRAKKSGLKTAPAYVYTFENPDGCIHVNWALHVPAGIEIEFEEKLLKWVEKVKGRIGPFDVHVQPISDDYAKYLAKYMFKGTDVLYVPHFHLGEVHEPQGKIHGKRAGISQAIGLKARSKAGFHPGKNRPFIFPRLTAIRGGQAATAGPRVIKRPEPGLSDPPV